MVLIIEHLGRAVYGGIYQPGHESADVKSFENYKIMEHIVLEHDDMKIANSPNGEVFTPKR